jgi:hypothetical protein
LEVAVTCVLLAHKRGLMHASSSATIGA